MKILALSWELSPYHGWGTSAINTVLGLREKGHEVEVLVHKVHPLEGVTQYNVLPNVLSLLYNPLLWGYTAFLLWRHIRRFKPDLVHIMTDPYMLALPLLPARGLPPFVVTACGTYMVLPLHTPRTQGQMLRAYRRIAQVLSISSYTGKRIEEEIRGIDPALAKAVAQKTSLITLGIMPPSKSPQRTVPAEEKHILFVGGMKARKGVHEVIEACGAFRKLSATPFVLEIIGGNHDTRYVEAMRKRIGELGLTDHVRIRGRVSEAELEQAYADGDLFMMLSKSSGHHFEGFGLVFLEANARGVPVIGPLHSGCEDAIAEGVSGFLVDPTDDPAVIAERMRRILEEGKISSDACKRWALEHSIRRQAEEVEKAYGRC
jgi:phosphatidyl-myo-inositol dimannoside synthase